FSIGFLNILFDGTSMLMVGFSLPVLLKVIEIFANQFLTTTCSFICEYTGELLEDEEAEKRENDEMPHVMFFAKKKNILLRSTLTGGIVNWTIFGNLWVPDDVNSLLACL
ncbi:hypothetical protein ACJX0J_013561, partial [Zea mays]